MPEAANPSAGDIGSSTARAAQMISGMSLVDALSQVEADTSLQGTGNEELDDIAASEMDATVGDDPDGESLAGEEDALLEGGPQSSVAARNGKPQASQEAQAQASEQGGEGQAASTDAGVGLTQEEISRLRESALIGESLLAQYQKNPIGFVQAMVDELPADQREFFLHKLTGGKAAAPAQTAPNLEGLTPQELFVEQNRAALEDVLKMRELPQQAAQQFQMHGQHIEELLVETQALRVALEEVLAANQVAMPKVDLAKLQADIKAGKDWREAVAEQVRTPVKTTLTKNGKRQAQAERPRPNTPGQGSAPVVEANDKSLVNILERLGVTF